MQVKLTDKEIFYQNVEKYKQDLYNSYANCLDYVQDDRNYITLKELGFEYGFKVANALFELGYASWSFIYFKNKQQRYDDLCSVIDTDDDLTEIQKDMYCKLWKKEILGVDE